MAFFPAARPASALNPATNRATVLKRTTAGLSFPSQGPPMKALPLLTDDLLKELDLDYPDRCPDPNDAERELWMKAGARRLVNSLLARRAIAEDSPSLPSVLTK